MLESASQPKPLFWVGPTLRVLRTFPDAVQRELGFALYLAQKDRKHTSAKLMKGFSGVLEIVAGDVSGTYRAVYMIRLAGAVYVLHTFQKKSKQAIRTPKHEIDLVRARLRTAEAHHAHWLATKEPGRD